VLCRSGRSTFSAAAVAGVLARGRAIWRVNGQRQMCESCRRARLVVTVDSMASWRVCWVRREQSEGQWRVTGAAAAEAGDVGISLRVVKAVGRYELPVPHHHAFVQSFGPQLRLPLPRRRAARYLPTPSPLGYGLLYLRDGRRGVRRSLRSRCPDGMLPARVQARAFLRASRVLERMPWQPTDRPLGPVPWGWTDGQSFAVRPRMCVCRLRGKETRVLAWRPCAVEREFVSCVNFLGRSEVT